MTVLAESFEADSRPHLQLVDTKEPTYSVSADLALIISEIEDGQQTAEGFVALQRVVEGSRFVLRQQANKFNSVWRVNYRDFEQAGVEGVYDAIARVDADKVGGFYNYAAFRVYDYMFRLSAEMGGAVCLKQGALKRVIEATRIARLVEEGGDFQELLDTYGMSEVSYTNWINMRKLLGALSFEAVVGEKEAEMVSAEYYDGRNLCVEDPADLYEDTINKKLITEAVSRLNPREQFVVKSYYGLDGYAPCTLREIGESLGVTESRICQIMSKCREKLAGHLAIMSEN